MIKYFIRHYWRYLAMALAFATISFFINSCDVNAETGIQTTNLNFGGIVTTPTQNIYMNNSNIFANWGRSYITFNLLITNNNTGGDIYPIKQIAVTSTNNVFICNYGNTEFTYLTTNQGYVYDVVCDVNIGSSGIQRIDIIFDNYDATDGVYVATSQYMTIYQNLELNIAQVLQQQQAITQGYLNTIHSSIDLNGTYIVNTIQTLQTQIINNNNTNTQAIIDKINELLENNQVCNIYDKNNIKTENKVLYLTGNEVNHDGYGITDYIKITNKSKIQFKSTNGNAGAYCFYNINKVKIECYVIVQQNINTNLTIPQNSAYIRSTIRVDLNTPQIEICDTSQNITNQQNEQIIQGQNDINNNITDSSIDNPSSDLDEINQNEISNSVISDLLLLPLNMFSNIVDSIGGTCSPFPLGNLLGSNLTLPCINIENLIGSNLWGVIDVLFCGIFVLSMRKKFVDIFENITSLKDRGNELE